MLFLILPSHKMKKNNQTKKTQPQTKSNQQQKIPNNWLYLSSQSKFGISEVISFRETNW